MPSFVHHFSYRGAFPASGRWLRHFASQNNARDVFGRSLRLTLRVARAAHAPCSRLFSSLRSSFLFITVRRLQGRDSLRRFAGLGFRPFRLHPWARRCAPRSCPLSSGLRPPLSRSLARSAATSGSLRLRPENARAYLASPNPESPELVPEMPP